MARFEITDRRIQAAYTISEAGHYLRVPPATIRYWARGNREQFGIIEVAALNPVLLSFVNLVELHVLTTMRRKYRVTLPKVRKSLAYLEERHTSSHPLVEYEFSTNGVDLFVEELGRQVNISKEGQIGLKGVIESALTRIQWDETGFPIKLYPYTRNALTGAPSVIAIHPDISGGRPFIETAGVAIEAIARRYKAGESLKELASDYECKEEEIEEAIRCELNAAA